MSLKRRKNNILFPIIIFTIIVIILILGPVLAGRDLTSLTGAAATYTCTGTPKSCGAYISISCPTASGCTLQYAIDGFRCTGTAYPCASFGTQAACTAIQGCSWTTAEICNDNVDNDNDGKADCADSDCTNDAACVPPTESNCVDGVDNDGDGKADCADSDCSGVVVGACELTKGVCAGASKICQNGQPVCNYGTNYEQGGETKCSDNLDNDCDSIVDCADSDCADDAACATPTCKVTNNGVEICDVVDNDCDGQVDNVDTASLQSDVNNCGICRNVCTNQPNALAGCRTGACVISACTSGYYDINLESSDGCEYACTITNNGVEIADGKDNDCDGELLPVERDMDMDGFSIAAGDCDDSAVGINPGPNTIDICTDNLDNDCDGEINDGCQVVATSDENLYQQMMGTSESSQQTSTSKESPASSIPTQNPPQTLVIEIRQLEAKADEEVERSGVEQAEVPKFPIAMVMSILLIILAVGGAIWYFTYYARPPSGEEEPDYTQAPRFTEEYPEEHREGY